MTYNQLQNDRLLAIKRKDADRKRVLADMLDLIQKTSITPKGRLDITDDMVNDCLIKYQKTVQEMIDTCPADRTELLERYQADMVIVKEYAPQLLTDEAEIEALIRDIVSDIGLTKENRGRVTKTVMGVLKGKADLKVVNQILKRIFE